MLVIKSFTQAILVMLLLLTMSTQISCKKNLPKPPKNNEIKATITFSSGVVLNTQTSGWNARFGCDLLGSSSWLESTDEINGNFYFSYYGPCVTAPVSTDQIIVQYTRYPNSQSSPIYSNLLVPSRDSNRVKSGSLTFTVVNGNLWEGFFDAVCWGNDYSDSVIIMGSFKGEKR